MSEDFKKTKPALKDEFKTQMKALLGAKFDDFLHCLGQKATRGVVLNKMIMPTQVIISTTNLNVQSLPFSDCCFKLESEEKLGNTWFHHGGLIYLQEPSSMVAGAVLSQALKDKSRPKILDLCASPGGKTIDLSLNFNGNCDILANEINFSRAKVLFSNIERLALNNISVVSNSPQEISKSCYEEFDGILVDAPCSGEGMFRKDPLTISEWTPDLPNINQKRQKEILKSAVSCLKVGGFLVYSTCTYNTLENEDVINFAVSELGLKILPVNKVIAELTEDGFIKGGNESLKLARRMFVGGKLGEGQFVCLMQKTQNSSNFSEKTAKNTKKPQKDFKNQQNANLKITREFLFETLKKQPKDDIKIIGDQVFLTDGNLCFVNLNYLSLGINIGQIKNGRMIPAHQFFKTMASDFKNVVNLNFNEAKSFLAGEELSCCENLSGFCAVFYSGVCLGGAKASGGRLKNYYPKGLRTKL